MKPLIESLPKLGGGCSSCGGKSEAIKNLMEDKPQTFVVQVVVEAKDVIEITRELLAKGKVLSANPYKDPAKQQSNVTFTTPQQTTQRQAFPAHRSDLNG